MNTQKLITAKRESEDYKMRKIINNIIITAEQICNSKDTVVLLVSVRKGVEYVNGKPTGNTDHHKYDSALPYNQFEKITVKIKGDPLVTQEQLEKNGGTLKVRFKNMTGKLYRTSTGEYSLSASADGLEVVN